MYNKKRFCLPQKKEMIINFLLPNLVNKDCVRVLIDKNPTFVNDFHNKKVILNGIDSNILSCVLSAS